MALATTSLAAAALLLGPDATLGIDVPTTGSTTSQVTQTVQSVTTTTQQAVTQVESTAQTTVQPVAQPVEQATQQAAAPVQQAAAPVTSAPKASTPSAPKPSARRTTAPAAAVPRTVAARKVAGSRLRQATTIRAVGGSARRTATAVTHTAAAPTTRLQTIRATRTHSSGSAGEESCDPTGVLGMLSPVLGLLGQDALLAVACDATAGLVQPRIGVSLPAATSVNSPAAAVLGVIAASQRLLHEQLSGKVVPVGSKTLGGPRVLRDKSGSAGPGVAAGATRFHAGGPSYGAAIAPAQAAAPAHASSAAAQAGEAHKHGLFGSPVTGTEALFALLAADWALLIAVFMWRYSRRWIRGPRFA